MLRIGDRYVVVDYKTNWLGDPAEPLTAADYAQPRLVEAMLHSDYPLQALLYSVVLHRFLRWRLPGYAAGEASRRRDVSVPARHVRAGHPGGRRPPGGGVQLAAAGVADHGDVGSARRGQGGRVTTVEWRQARGATGLLRAFTRRRGSRVVGCACGAAAYRAGEGAATRPSRWRSRWRCGRCGTVRCASTCGRSSSRSAWTACRGRTSTHGWRPFAASTLAGTPPALRVDGDLLYLDRYWLEEQQVADDVHTMIAVKPEKVSPDIDRLFPQGFEEQRAAAKVALAQGLTVLTGGPGTGKTTTVARLLALLASGHAIADRAGGADGQGGGTIAGGGAAGGRQAGRGRPGGAVGNACDDAAPAARAAGRTRRRGSGTTGATGCRTT